MCGVSLLHNTLDEPNTLTREVVSVYSSREGRYINARSNNMTDITLLPITSGYNLSKINSNFVKLQLAVNNDILHLAGGNNVMLQDLDMNNNALLNLGVDVNNPDSVLTVGEADLRYYNVDGDTLSGVMDVAGSEIINLAIPTDASSPVRKDQLDAEIAARVAADAAITAGYTSGDAYLQDQISGGAPLAASAFSPISWHDQNIMTSVNIPDNKNAWSFGPTMSIDLGQTVTVGAGSFWTIANGEVV